MTQVSKLAMVIIAALLLPTLVFATACAPEATEGAIKVQISTDLTGPYAGVMKFIYYGTIDYFDYVNEEKGGIRGYEVVVLSHDDKSDAALSSTYYDQARTEGIVTRFQSTTPSLLAVLSKLEADQIPSIGVAASATLFNPPSWHYSTVGDWAKQFCSALDGYFYPKFKEAGGTDPMRLSLVCWDMTLGRSGPPAVEALMAMRPGRYEVVSTTFPSMVTMDYVTDLSTAKAANPDIILAFVSGSAAGMMARDAGQAGLPKDIPIICDYSSMFNESSIEIAGPQMVYGWAYNWFPLPDEDYEAAKIARHLVDKYDRVWDPGYINGLCGALVFHYAAEKALEEVGYERLSGAAIKAQLDKMDNVDLGLVTLVSFADFEGDREGPSSIRVLEWDEAKGEPVVVSDWFPMFTFKEFYGLG